MGTWQGNGGRYLAEVAELPSEIDQDMEMNQIEVSGLIVHAHIGVPTTERRTPQKLVVDLTIDADLSEAIENDDFRRTIDYLEIVGKVEKVAKSRPFSLVEGLAGAIAESVLDDMRVRALRLKVRKFPADLHRKVSHVAVELTRTQSEG